jgi:transcriptional regulatory protein LevR
MPSDTIKLDEDGIPVLENPVVPEALKVETETPESVESLPDLTDHEVVAQLLQNPEVQTLIGDMSEDLQKLVAWKIESLVKEQVTQLIQQAVEESASKLAEDIHTQLQLAMPGLLANLVERAKSPESE